MKTNEKTNNNVPITNWGQFMNRVKATSFHLLKKIDDFPDPILISGCQRSGTTILTRILSQSKGMYQYKITKDDELDAALILSGHASIEQKGRYCFQTTYLNSFYHEYFTHSNYKLIWVLRNPFSVVYSMLHNWGHYALNDLFKECGSLLLTEKEMLRYQSFGIWPIGRFRRACLSYNAKTAQLFEISDKLNKKDLLVIDYDDLVFNKDFILPAIYDFINIPYDKQYADKLHSKSIKKQYNLSKSKREQIKTICMPVYEKALALLS